MHPRRAEAARTGMHAGSHRAVCARARLRGAHGVARGTGGGRGDTALRLACQSPEWTPNQHCCSCTGSGGSDVAPGRPTLERAAAAGMVSASHMEHLQWVPAHCGLPDNEQADALTKEATGLIQQDTPFDARTLAGATARRAKRSWLAVRLKGWYSSIMADSEPPRRCGAPPERRGTSISSGRATGNARNSIITASVDVPPISANSAATPAAQRFGVWSAGSLRTHLRTSSWSAHTFWACASVTRSHFSQSPRHNFFFCSSEATPRGLPAA